MGSSRYFVPHELTLPGGGWDEVVHPEELAGGIERVRRIALD